MRKLLFDNSKKGAKGSITVYLSLILLLILALICTVIEGTRIYAARVHARRALATAMDSALAGYYAPLWNEYHLFGLHTGDEDYARISNTLAGTVKSYLEYTLDPDRDLPGSLEKGMDLFGLRIKDISLQKRISLMDYEGELFINQAVEYMKYADIADGLELLLDKLSMLEQPAQVSYIMEEKQKLEEELVKIDEELLKLMRLYDGLETGRKGLVLDKNGAIKTRDSFIKMICFNEITMENVAINSPVIFQAQKDKYINPTTACFQYIKKSLDRIELVRMQISGLQAEIARLEKLAAECQALLDSINSKEEKTEEDIEDVKKLNKSIQEYKDSNKELKRQITEQEDIINSEIASAGSKSDFLSQLAESLLPLYDEAMASVNKILDRSRLAGPLIDSYESLLSSKKNSLSEELYEGLKEELDQLKKYIGTGSGNYDFSGMLKTLEGNKRLLSELCLTLAAGRDALHSRSFATAARLYAEAEASLSNYRIRELAIDYSSLVFERDNKNKALDKVNEVIAEGLCSLVIDPSDISEALLGSLEELPSFLHTLTEGKGSRSGAVEAYFAEAGKGDKNISSGELFGELRKESELQGLPIDDLNKLAQMVLLREYLGEHFYTYKAKGSLVSDRKPTALSYELEYLINGNNSDKANLNAIITRIILIRMIFDFISVISDKAIRNEAKLIASSLVGFTGLTILVYITQMLILLIWSFAEALLDTAAIMMGKRVAIYKRKVEMTLPDILTLSRQQLASKASAMAEPKELSLSYDEYIKIFLYMTDKETLVYRSMDLMQENIRLRYNDDTFSMARCLYGFELSGEFEIKRRFTRLGFLQSFFESGSDSYQFRYIVADSY